MTPGETHEARPLLVVDGDNLAHRAYHSTPKTVRDKHGEPVNAIVGFMGMLASVWASERPRGVFVAWDTLGVETYRHALWPAYQGGRVFEDEILVQLDALPGVCRAFGFGAAKTAGYEADDLMAAAVRIEVVAGGSCLLLTTDRDAYQLVSGDVTVLSPRRGVRELERVGPREVVERLGVLPEQVADFKALAGDASDGIPGAKGIGAKTAAALLLAHGTLEGVLARRGRPAEADRLLMFRELVRMRADVEVALPSGAPDWASGAETLRALGASALAERVGRLAME